MSAAERPEEAPLLAAVAIGRNEGQRLVDCLSSIPAGGAHLVYVDSDSHDGSPLVAEKLNAQVIQLDMSKPFTAARARNAGYGAAVASRPDLEFIQFVDGDCALDPEWIGKALAFMRARPDVAVVFGRRRERFVERSIYNAMCDREWDGPAGQAQQCGGDILVRVAALREAGAYRSSLIAGEEPELCVRLREKGWTIWRLDAEMTLHDANITTFRQWWRRTTRAGHAFAEVATLHWSSPKAIWKRSMARAIVWGGALPLAILVAVLVHPAALLLFGLYPLQVARIARREGWTRVASWRHGFFDVLGKFAEFNGVTKYFVNRLLRRSQRIIEYK
jgi:GT2 family glycosyltransferase